MQEKMERAKSCAEIGRELETTRSNVSQTLKRALTKVYNKILYEHELASRPTEALLLMLKHFNINNDEDAQEFFKILPKQIKSEVENDIERNGAI